MTKEPANINQRLEQINMGAIDQLLLGFFVLAIFSTPLSLGRISITGWQAAHYIHIFSLFVVALLFFGRHRLSYNKKKWIVLSVSLLIASVGLLTYGIIANGLIWCMFSLLSCLFFVDIKTTVKVLLFCIGLFAFSMFQFVYLEKPFPGDANTYANSLVAWGLSFIGSGAFVILITVSLMNQRKHLFILLDQLEEQKSIITAQKKRLEHQANHDHLTGLPTLRLANDRLELVLQIAKRSKHKAALLFLDLDGFKAVNDDYGHEIGDAVLKEIAHRISTTIRKIDTACRIGGDEFIVIMSEVKSDNDVPGLCERLIDEINKPVVLDGITTNVGVSIGVSIYPNHVTDSKNMRILADQLMYKVKRSGKNSYQISEEDN